MSLLLRMYPGDSWAFDIAVVLVQITVVGVLGSLMASLGSRRGAAFRHGVWFCVLIGILLSPALTFSLHSAGISLITVEHQSRSGPMHERTSPGLENIDASADGPGQIAMSDGIIPSEAIAAPSHLPAEEMPTSSRPDYLRACGGLAAVAWLTGVSYFLLQGLHGSWIVFSLRRSTRAWKDDNRNAILDDVRKTLGEARLPPIVLSHKIDGPVAMGLLRPLILLPAPMENASDRETVRDVLIHEIAHVRRRDAIVGFLQRAAEMFFWPHPIVHYMNGELARAREEVCDNYVLRRGDPARYARTLFELAQRVSSRPRMAAPFGLFPPRWRLEDRIAGLLDPRRKTMTRMSRLATAGLIALSFSVAVVIAGVGTEDHLKDLLQERLQTANEYAVATRRAYKFETCSFPELLRAEKALRDVQLDTASTAAERNVVLEDYFKTMSTWAAKIESLHKGGVKGGEDEKYYAARLAAQSAKIDLLRERFHTQATQIQ